MKTIIYFSLLLLLLGSCGQKEKTQENPLATTLITGRVLHRNIYPRQNSLKVIIPSFEHGETIEECEIKGDGTFAFRFQPLALRDIAIETFVPYLLVRPGDSLYVEIDFQDLTKVTFSGTAGKLNQDLYAFTDGGGYYLRQASGTNARMMPPEAFRKKMEKQRRDRVKRCEDFFRTHSVEPDLEKWIKKGLEAEYYSLLLDYGSIHSLLTGGDAVPESYFDFMPQIEALYADPVLHSQMFELAAQLKHRMISQLDTLAGMKQRPEQLAGTVENEQLAQFLVATDFYQSLTNNEVTYFEENQEYFDQHITHPLLHETLLRKYEATKAFLANPKPVSDALLYGVNHESALASVASQGMQKLQDLVKANAGKGMYINFWSGCAAGVAELKQIGGMAEEYQGKDIEFISITADHAFLREVAKRQGLKGQVHYWTDQDIQDIMKSWHVTWSPYYLLINKEGVIVDYGTYLRPGASLREKIDQIVNE